MSFVPLPWISLCVMPLQEYHARSGCVALRARAASKVLLAMRSAEFTLFCSNSQLPYNGRSRSSAVRYGRQTSDRPSRAGNTHYITIQRVQSRSERGCGGWARLQGGSGAVALSGCVGHARYGIPELKERSVSARKYACDASAKWETVHAGQKKRRVASVSNRVLATRAKSDIEEIAVAPIRDCVRGYNAKWGHEVPSSRRQKDARKSDAS
eukprot:1120508-Pleurochrysis_carterae.AAC.2